MTRRRHNRRASSELLELLGPAPTAVRVAGVEHEFVVRRGGEPIDFRKHIDALGLGARLDPGDVHAHLGEWGGVITADGWEAEVVSPPVAIQPGVVGELRDWVAVGRSVLEAALERDDTLTGYSTHINVEIPDRDAVRLAREFALRFSPAAALLIERSSSPGLLVRPRRGRLEVGGEYASGDALEAALTFTMAATAQLASASRRAERTALPPRLALETKPAQERYGLYVDRTASGRDLYAGGRTTLLRSARGTLTAQDHLEATWTAVRPRAVALVESCAVAIVDDIVSGSRTLPLEREDDDLDRPSPLRPASAYARALAGARRGDVEVQLKIGRWEMCVFEVRRDRATRYVSVPRPWLTAFLDALDDGTLDRALERWVATTERKSVAA